MTAKDNALAAEALGARLPPLLIAADRVASTVAQGVVSVVIGDHVQLVECVN